MALFEPIVLTWAGREYEIPADQVMRAIAKVEDILSFVQIARAFQERDLPLVKISQAYAAALRHAGARVTDEEVYGALFVGDDLQSLAIKALQTLQLMMIPPAHLRKGAPEGKAVAGKTAQSSKKPSRQR